MDLIIGIFLSLVLVLLNGFFVAIEFALARVNKTRVEQMVNEGDKTAELILKALNKIDSYISTSQIGITISSLALGAIGELSIAKFLTPIVEGFLPSPITDVTAHSIALPIALLIVTYFHVVIGEIIPKTIAFINPERAALVLIWPLEIFRLITSPLVILLNSSASTILRLFGITDLRTTFVYTEDELRMLLNVSHEEGVLEESEKEMITNIFDFPGTVAREIMTPRPDIVSLGSGETIEEALKLVIESKHSRIPIFEESIDNIIGVITVRDLLEQTHLGNDKKLVKEIVKPIIKVPESKPLDDLLTEFRRKSLQMAIVIGEFGGTSGIVTMEDIIEEIVGEIRDEYDTEVDSIQILPNADILIDGKLTIDEVNEKLGTNFSMEHYDTIGGYTFGLIGTEFHVGDEVQSDGYILKVEVKDKDRVKLLRLRKVEESEVEGKETVTEKSNGNGKHKKNSKNGSSKEESKSES
jgi:CBS domain containing-hemolysin-like protein